jgi:hypothetical protein
MYVHRYIHAHTQEIYVEHISKPSCAFMHAYIARHIWHLVLCTRSQTRAHVHSCIHTYIHIKVVFLCAFASFCAEHIDGMHNQTICAYIPAYKRTYVLLLCVPRTYMACTAQTVHVYTLTHNIYGICAVKSAAKRLLAHVQWRKDYKMDTIVQEDWSNHDQRGEMYTSGIDKWGRPTMTWKLGMYKAANQTPQNAVR